MSKKKKSRSKNPSTGVKLPKFKMSRQSKESMHSGKLAKKTYGRFRNKK